MVKMQGKTKFVDVAERDTIPTTIEYDLKERSGDL